MSKSFIGAVAILSLSLSMLMHTPAAAQEKHDSNSLHKLGKAIEYPFRKTGANVSITTHRVLGKNSVEHRRNGNRTHDTIITPKGHLHRIRHRRHHYYKK